MVLAVVLGFGMFGQWKANALACGLSILYIYIYTYIERERERDVFCSLLQVVLSGFPFHLLRMVWFLAPWTRVRLPSLLYFTRTVVELLVFGVRGI